MVTRDKAPGKTVAGIFFLVLLCHVVLSTDSLLTDSSPAPFRLVSASSMMIEHLRNSRGFLENYKTFL